MAIRQANSLIRSIYPWPVVADISRGEDAKMAVFIAAKGLVREAEAVVIGLGQPIRWNWLDKVVLTLFLAPYFVFAGFRMLLFRLAAGGMTMGALYLAMRVLASGPPQGSPFWPAAIMAACIIAFGLPSDAGVTGVTTKKVGLVLDSLTKISKSCEVSRLKEGVNLIRARSLERVARLNWMLGIAWALVFWFYTSHVFALGLPGKVGGEHITESLAYVLAFFLFALGASCYIAAIQVLYQTLDFAFLEHERTHAQ